MDFLDENKISFYFIIPCIGNIRAFKFGNGRITGHEYYKPFKVFFNSGPHDIIEISSSDKNKPFGFINHYKIDFDDDDYSYIEEKMIKPIICYFLR